MRNGTFDKIVALDVGGSHISAGVFDLRDQSIAEVGHVLIPSGGTAEAFIEILVKLCRKVLPAPASLGGLAAAFPNPFDYERGVSLMKHKFQQLYGVDLRHALAGRLDCDVGNIHFLNDAAAYLIGELHQGAARGVDRAVGITLGTGIGSAFAVGGRIVASGQGVPPEGKVWNLAYQGGIVENFAGTPAIQRLYLEERNSALGTADPMAPSVRDIAAAAVEDEPLARATFERFGTELGKLLRFTTAEFAPQRIVIGGGIARSSTLFFPHAHLELADLGVELSVSQLGDRAPLIGAATSWLERPR